MDRVDESAIYGQVPRRLSSKRQAEKAQVDLGGDQTDSNLISSLFCDF